MIAKFESMVNSTLLWAKCTQSRLLKVAILNSLVWKDTQYKFLENFVASISEIINNIYEN